MRIYHTMAALVLLSAVSVPAMASAISVTERTRTYRVSGDTVQAAVKSMKRNGPFSELHGRRALGMADYRYRTSVKTKTSDKKCRVEKASVDLRIFYILPKHTKPSKMRARDRSRWRQIRSMIVRHEHHHGRLYRQFVLELQRALSRIKPQSNCNKVRKIERELKTKFETRNMQRNRRYDRGQYRPFNNRLKRLAPKQR